MWAYRASSLLSFLTCQGIFCTLARTLVTSVRVKIKRQDSFAVRRSLQDLGMAQRPSGIAVAGSPMLLHAEP
jgi:hypothetical protein